MRFAIFFGCMVIAKCVNAQVLANYSSMLGWITIILVLLDVYEFYVKVIEK